jgi:hypothetical protein
MPIDEHDVRHLGRYVKLLDHAAQDEAFIDPDFASKATVAGRQILHQGRVQLDINLHKT